MTSPQLGQGANLALIDAAVLADCLREEPSLAAALAAYAEQRRAHTRFYSYASRWLTPFFQSDSRVAALVRDLTFPIAGKVPYVRREMVRTLCGMKTGLFTHLDPGQWHPDYALGTPRSLQPARVAHQQADQRQVRLDLEAVAAVLLAFERAHARVQHARQRDAEDKHVEQPQRQPIGRRVEREHQAARPDALAQQSRRVSNCTERNSRAPNAARPDFPARRAARSVTRSGWSLPSGGSENSAATSASSPTTPALDIGAPDPHRRTGHIVQLAHPRRQRIESLTEQPAVQRAIRLPAVAHGYFAGCLARNSSTCLWNAGGSSAHSMCDTFGMITRSEPLISRWIASDAATGVAGSSLPTITRVGSVMRLQPVGDVEPANALAPAGIAFQRRRLDHLATGAPPAPASCGSPP